PPERPALAMHLVAGNLPLDVRSHRAPMHEGEVARIPEVLGELAIATPEIVWRPVRDLPGTLVQGQDRRDIDDRLMEAAPDEPVALGGSVHPETGPGRRSLGERRHVSASAILPTKPPAMIPALELPSDQRAHR